MVIIIPKICLHLIKQVDCHGIRCNLGMFTYIFWTQNQRKIYEFLLSVSIHYLLGLEEILINNAYIGKLPVPFVYSCSNVQDQIPQCRPNIRSGMKWICTRNPLSSLIECSISISLLDDVVSSWVHIHSFTFPTILLFMMTEVNTSVFRRNSSIRIHGTNVIISFLNCDHHWFLH